MLRVDRDALACDLAETYGLFEMTALPARKLAVLACGLRENSRIMMKMRGDSYSMDTLLLASIVDRLSFIAWTKTEDAKKNRNRPKMMVDALLNPGKADGKADYAHFASGEEFEAARNRILGRL